MIALATQWVESLINVRGVSMHSFSWFQIPTQASVDKGGY